MDFDIVTPLSELGVAPLLEWLRFLARSFEFNQQRPSAWDKEQAIRPTVVATKVELDVVNSKITLNLVAC